MKSSPDMKNASGNNENRHPGFEGLSDTNPRRRLQAVQSLTRETSRISTGEGPAPAMESKPVRQDPAAGWDIPELLTAFKDMLHRETDSYVAATVIRSIGLLGGPDDLESVIPFLSDRAPRVRANTVEILGRLGNKEQLKQLLPCLNDLNNRVRANAAVALNGEYPQRCLEVLGDMIRNRDTRSRLSAVYGCLEIDTAEAATLLEALTQDDNEQVAATAASALRTMNDRGNETAGMIIERLGDELAGPGGTDSFVMVNDGSLIKLTPEPDAVGAQRSLLASLRSSFEIKANIDLKKPSRGRGDPGWEREGSTSGKPDGEERKAEKQSRTFTGWSYMRSSDEKYMVGGEIGRGGMGVILNALDTDIRREVAMKVMSCDRAVPREHIERFVEEVQVQGQLEHPHICPVHELGMDSKGRVYFTMKMVKGASLANQVKKARENETQPDAQALTGLLNTSIKICDGIAYAHSKGVIHRDLKPANIMVGDFGEVYVMDWGLARILGRADERQESLVITDRTEETDTMKTMDGSIIGTPAYMPPEQAAGQVDEMDERSDIYSLGALLYELLTLESPFDGSCPWDIIRKVKQEIPALPSARAPRQFIPPELDVVVMKCMAKEKNERYQSVGELKHDIELYLSGRPIESMEYSLWQVFRKWVKRNIVLTVSIAAVLAILGSSFTVSYIKISRSEKNAVQAREIAEEQKIIAEQKEKEATTAKIEEEMQKEIANAQRDLARASAREANERLVMSLVSQGTFLEEKGDLTGAVRTYEEARKLIIEYGLDLFPFIDLMLWKARYCSGGYRKLIASWDTENKVYAVDISSDGNMVASGGLDEKVTVRNLKTGEIERILSVNGDNDIHCVAFNHNGTLLAAGNESGSIRIWQPKTGRLITTLLKHTAPVRSVNFSHDGQQLISGGDDGKIRTWDLETGTTRTMDSDQTVASAVLSPDNSILAAGGHDNTVTLWQAQTHERLPFLYGHEGYVNDVVFSPDGGLLASGSSDKTLKLCALNRNNIHSSRVVATLQGHGDEILATAMSPDGRLLATASGDTTIRFWDVRKRKSLSFVKGHTDAVCSVAFGSGKNFMVSGGKDCKVNVWDMTDTGNIITIDTQGCPVSCLAFSPDGTMLASALYMPATGPVISWGVEDGKKIASYWGHAGSAYTIAFSQNGKILASAGRDEAIRLLDPRKGTEISSMRERGILSWALSKVNKLEKKNVYALTFSTDGKTLFTGGQDRSIKLWDIENKVLAASLEGCHGDIVSLSVHPEGRLLAAGCKNKVLELWDIVKHRRSRTFEAHQGDIKALAFNYAGTVLATGATDNTIKFWNIHDKNWIRNPTAILKGHTGNINSLAFNTKGTILASGSGDGTVKLWLVSDVLDDARSYIEPLITLEEHDGGVTSVAFSPDGSTLVSGGEDSTIVIFKLGNVLKPLKR